MLSVSVFCVSDSVSVSVVFVSVLFLFSGSVVSMCLVLFWLMFLALLFHVFLLFLCSASYARA